MPKAAGQYSQHVKTSLALTGMYFVTMLAKHTLADSALLLLQSLLAAQATRRLPRFPRSFWSSAIGQE